MQETSADFLAGAGFSLEQDRHVGGCDPLQLLTDCLHRGGPPKDDV